MYALIDNGWIVDIGFTIPLIMKNTYNHFGLTEIKPKSIRFIDFFVNGEKVELWEMESEENKKIYMCISKPVDLSYDQLKKLIDI